MKYFPQCKYIVVNGQAAGYPISYATPNERETKKKWNQLSSLSNGLHHLFLLSLEGVSNVAVIILAFSVFAATSTRVARYCFIWYYSSTVSRRKKCDSDNVKENSGINETSIY